MRQNPAGFTLIELMITVALIAIVTMISVTSYRQYMLRANRTDAASILLRIAAAQERWYLDNNRYTDDPVTDLRIGPLSERGFYTVKIRLIETGYIATATPVPGGPQSTDADCQVLSINETGQRQSLPEDIDVCWH